MSCKHFWVTNNGRGGQPFFEINKQISSEPIIYVKCMNCLGRTWFTRKQWEIIEKYNPVKGK